MARRCAKDESTAKTALCSVHESSMRSSPRMKEGEGGRSRFAAPLVYGSAMTNANIIRYLLSGCNLEVPGAGTIFLCVEEINCSLRMRESHETHFIKCNLRTSLVLVLAAAVVVVIRQGSASPELNRNFAELYTAKACRILGAATRRDTPLTSR